MLMKLSENKGDNMLILQGVIEKVKENLFQKVAHPYLFQYIKNPTIDEDRILLTIFLLKEAGLKENEIITYASTIMLVQIALDTHELVTNEKIQNGLEKNRQLTVLAGDFFSGQYYKILADIEDIKMIKVLAEGIKEVNEHKIHAYQLITDRAEQLLETIGFMEFSLLNKFLDYFGLEQWESFSFSFLQLKRLISEKKAAMSSEVSPIMNMLQRNGQVVEMTSSGNEIGMMDRYIQIVSDNLQTEMNVIPKNHLLWQRAKELINEHIQLHMYAEEG